MKYLFSYILAFLILSSFIFFDKSLSKKINYSAQINTNKSLCIDSSYFQFSRDTSITYTDNAIYLRGNKLNFDSLSPFFKYKDVKRIDLLSKKLDNHTQDFKEVAFFKNFIQTSRGDSLYFADYQFLVGNLATRSKLHSTLIFITKWEDWGIDLILLSIDKNGNIIDGIETYQMQGDGGDFYETTLNYKNDSTYLFTNKNGYSPYTQPIDTVRYTQKQGFIQLNYNGTFEKCTTKIDSNLVEIVHYKDE